MPTTTTQQVDPTETTISTTTNDPLLAQIVNEDDKIISSNDIDNGDEEDRKESITNSRNASNSITGDDGSKNLGDQISAEDQTSLQNLSNWVDLMPDVSSSSHNKPGQTDASSASMESNKQRLHDIVELIADQDAKLKHLTTLRKLVKDQASMNTELSKELKLVNESITEKDDELRQALNKVDNLNRQLKSCKRARAIRNRSSLSVSKQQKSTEGPSNSLGRRVSFDPLSLLLDAALEGELDLVIKTSKQVTDLSAAHDECVTALHNAAVAGHYDVAKYLIEAGCDINVQDSDGWTPLHCAANCNNLPLAKLLIENGATIYATTYGKNKTPAELCEETEENYEDCHKYLTEIQNNLGVINGGVVYALYDYSAQREDELSFYIDEELEVLNRDNDDEQEWWWAQKKVKSNDAKVQFEQGYIPRNLVGLYRRRGQSP